MAGSKIKDLKIARLLLWAYLVLFPLGQLIRLPIASYTKIVLYPTDVLVGLMFLIYIIKVGVGGLFTPPLKSLLTLSMVSLLISLNWFSTKEVFIGSLYLFRVLGYIGFYKLVRILIKEKLLSATRLSQFLLGLSLVSATLGWLQYLFLPDVRFLKLFGWDDHYYRMVGSFLDPGYLAILLVFGILFAINFYLDKKTIKMFVAIVFLGLALALTYSRAGYLALLIGSFVLLLRRGYLKYFVLLLILFILIVINLPRPPSEGVQLERTKSVVARLTNYRETLAIVQKSPIFGVGFNNLCAARQKFIKRENPLSHSCSGSDSSVLFILSTVGIVGLILIIHWFLRSIYLFRNSILFVSLTSSLIVSSLFANTFFYPWLMGFMALSMASLIKAQGK